MPAYGSATMKHSFDPSILRAYDIRGQVDKTLFAADAYAIGRAFGTLARRRLGGKPHIAVGRDGRLTSPTLAAQLIEGLAASGCHVADLGVGPTPMTYFAVASHELDGGLMITGSHNPIDYNGFKMLLGGMPFYGDDIRELGRIAAEGDLESGEGDVSKLDVLQEYATCVAEAYEAEIDVPLTVAWDCGNGAAGDALNLVLKALPGTHHVLFDEIDGSFPNHHPDPTVPANLEDVKRLVVERGCDMGIAFDGDGDRCGLIDDEGEVIWADQYLIFLAEEVLQSLPGATIIADVKASQTLFDRVAAAGGEALMWRTGHSLIKVKMKETKSPLAGEMSGHVFFADKYFGYDDGLYTAVRIMNHVAQTGLKLSDFRKSLPKLLNTPELRFDCPEAQKQPVMAHVQAKVADGSLGRVIDVDGVRCVSEEGWWLLRPSNTESVLVGRVEARDTQALERLKARLFDLIAAAGLNPEPQGH